MNGTPRKTNRMLLTFVGLILLALGAGMAVVAWVPEVTQWWQDWAPGAVSQLVSTVSDSAISAGQGTSVLWVGLVIILVIVIIVMVSIIAKQGRGRATLLGSYPSAGGTPGTVALNGSIAEKLFKEAFETNPEVFSSSVVTYDFKKHTGVKVRLISRRGIPPHQLAEDADQLTKVLRDLFGKEVPVLVSIGFDTRARLSKQDRLR